ncbi:TetR/AcrR family transcriptional regulator [Wukongibacter baidiensis]|uniref:TetR/AcrR family transcriptional regulator n=1 Tax=Wukongibacter baidiensis TaxID=1723361 RepID=UPI003D7F7048
MPKLSEEKKSERRDYILDIAFELFAEKGYASTGMRDIMKASNISKGGIYVYFNSKLEILLGIMQRIDSKRRNILKDIDSSLSADQILSQYLERRLEIFKYPKNHKWAKISLMFWSLPKDIPELKEIDDERYKAYRADIEHIINQGIMEGVFRASYNVDSMVYQIMSTINGVGVLSGVMGRVITDTQIKDIVDMHLKYLKGE